MSGIDIYIGAALAKLIIAAILFGLLFFLWQFGSESKKQKIARQREYVAAWEYSVERWESGDDGDVSELWKEERDRFRARLEHEREILAKLEQR